MSKIINIQQLYICIHNQTTRVLYHKKYCSILETLEANNITTNSQCRAGYCGVCRASLIYGTITYLKQPLAYVQKHEILICCTLPKTNIQIKL
ncbi:class I ribonucleotide reductase maintenance protein YfaE [Blochmannia endosymbiont of Polyrhachis (Hedomyrma) turneri]|uniref:class I ribonucleotide reductase maintenance protein YfaE n=1 Tax=Blochmannia endosymbiont of Polyrhachis (Hedomyrma) turneri TaxID=1505596 RepID=UPI00061A62A8|nr:class I ribonucleotide reductase maintenance protein YfaE [Blochmannia endosymbiont of Polyrhachis (Hedomyrma) turneri]AKC60042.1 ferredoxin-like protein [Blochmannia endosymbiont of Polyrhachis (Hedomyrma) turneri]